jgi:hypothetical protein
VLSVTFAQTRLARLRILLHRYGDLLWWLHSSGALLIGCGVMWLGSRHHGLLRLAILQLAFVWVAALVVPALAARAKASSRWAERGRLVINYFSKNFYQQLLFFLLPLYYASASAWSWNLLFVAFLAVSAVLSTLDVVYDRHLSVKRSLMAVFFAFNLFACLNVMLPTIWSLSNAFAMRASAVLAVVAFMTILVGRRAFRWPQGWVLVGVTAAALLITVEFARPLIPPAPLRLVSGTFGVSLAGRTPPRIGTAVDRVDPGWTGLLYVVAAVYAPNGLVDRIGQRWYVNDQLVWASRFYEVTGGRADGYRLWTPQTLKEAPRGRVRVDVVTEAGQLVGRCSIPIAPAPPPDAGNPGQRF